MSDKLIRRTNDAGVKQVQCPYCGRFADFFEINRQDMKAVFICDGCSAFSTINTEVFMTMHFPVRET